MIDFAQHVNKNELSLVNLKITNQDIIDLVEFIKNTPNITSLDLLTNKIGIEGAQALANSPHLANLTSLYLSYNSIGDAGAQTLANSPHLANLTSLDLLYNSIGDAGAQALANSPHLANLTSLYLSYNSIGDAGAQTLANSPHLANLTSLDLLYNSIGDAGAQALANSPHLANLTYLNLSSSNIGDAGAQALANSPHLANLTFLDLSYNNIKIAGAKSLAESPHLANLTFLDLADNNIKIAGAQALAQSQKNRKAIINCRFGDDNKQIIYDTLSKVYQDRKPIDHNIMHGLIFALAPHDDRLGDSVKYFLERPDEFPFQINSRDSAEHSLLHFYTQNPEMTRWLFEHGVVPNPRKQEDRRLEDIVNDNQSVHSTEAIEQTRFFMKQLLQEVGNNTDQLKLTQNAEALTDAINQLKTKDINVTKEEKDYIMKPILRILEEQQKGIESRMTDNHLKSLKENKAQQERIKAIQAMEPKEFINFISDRAVKILEDSYLKKDNSGAYEPRAKATDRIQYDYTKGQEKYTTIPETLGLVKLLIDQSPDNLSAEKNLFILAKQLYITSATYGENSPACTWGTFTQILEGASEINPKFIERYSKYLDDKKKLDKNATVIDESNVDGFTTDISSALIKAAEQNSEFAEKLSDSIFYIDTPIEEIPISDPSKITLKQQALLAPVNKSILEIIGKLPNYLNPIPYREELALVVPFIGRSSMLQNWSVRYEKAKEESAVKIAQLGTSDDISLSGAQIPEEVIDTFRNVNIRLEKEGTNQRKRSSWYCRIYELGYSVYVRCSYWLLMRP